MSDIHNFNEYDETLLRITNEIIDKPITTYNNKYFLEITGGGAINTITTDVNWKSKQLTIYHYYLQFAESKDRSGNLRNTLVYLSCSGPNETMGLLYDSLSKNKNELTIILIESDGTNVRDHGKLKESSRIEFTGLVAYSLTFHDDIGVLSFITTRCDCTMKLVKSSLTKDGTVKWVAGNTAGKK